MTEWQPIDTAPQPYAGFVLLAVKWKSWDGQRHIGYKWQTRIGFWDDNGSRWLDASCFGRYREGKIKGHGYVIHNITHWMPIPNPPPDLRFV